jgi:hypothetical protein
MAMRPSQDFGGIRPCIAEVLGSSTDESANEDQFR